MQISREYRGFFFVPENFPSFRQFRKRDAIEINRKRRTSPFRRWRNRASDANRVTIYSDFIARAGSDE